MLKRKGKQKKIKWVLERTERMETRVEMKLT